uniref:Retrotransposon gag domain-containing protein n=1 Tax=Tanacetum cinerariifolium TaxID=118510 RepID=A0A699HHX2_TANCI|nr:hypothetical protein [Tanacetum cinerariifolium]
MKKDINFIFGRMVSLSRRLCGREMVHALVEKKGKAKDELYGKLILDLGNEVRCRAEQGTAAMEKLVENLGNAKDKNERVERDLYWTRVRAHEFYQEMIRRGFVFKERPNEAIDIPTNVRNDASGTGPARGQEEGKKVRFTAATLLGSALTWWNSKTAIMEVQRIEHELWNLKVKEYNIVAYIKRFNELALMSPGMVEPERVKEEDDMEVDIEEDENKPELTYLYEEMDPLNPLSPAPESEPEDAIEDKNSIEHEDETVHASVHEKKGKAKDELYGKLNLDLGNKVHYRAEQGMTAMEKLVENLGNAEDKVECKKLKKELEEARGVMFEERPNEAIDVLIKDNIVAAIAAERARQTNVRNDASGTRPARGQEGAPAFCEFTFAGFMKWNPTTSREGKKVRFAAATLQGPTLTWWNSKTAIMGLETMNRMPWTEMKQLMTVEFCPIEEVQRIEHELWNLKVKEYNIVAYIQGFNELALMCPRMVEPKRVKVTKDEGNDGVEIIMVNIIPCNHVDDVHVVEPDQHDNVPVILEPVVVDEDEDPKEDKFEEEEDPQEEEDDIEVDIEEDENEPELTYLYEEMDPLNPLPPAPGSEPKDAIEVKNSIEYEDETVPASVHEVGKSSTTLFLHEDSDDLFPSLMKRDINSLFSRMAFLSRRPCGRETVHALVENKGKAKDELYVENLGNAEDKVECKKLKKELEEARGFLFEERPNEAIDVPDNVDASIAAERARQTNVRNDASGTGPARGQEGEPAFCECTFAGFMKCNPTASRGSKGAVELMRWFKKIESVF